MIILTEDLKNICNKLKIAFDNKSGGVGSGAIEIYTDGVMLNLCVASQINYVKTSINIHDNVDFHATISAAQFFKLIAQTTSDTIELTCTEKFMKIKGNGTYKIPLIFDVNGSLLVLPKIEMKSVDTEMDIETKDLTNIMKYNSKIVRSAVNPISRLYYLDEKGCLTFTSIGACVNSFNMEKACKFLIGDTVVKMFKLFSSDKVHFKYGHMMHQDVEQVVVSLTGGDVELTVLSQNDKSVLDRVPAVRIRERANTAYPHTVEMNALELSKAISRLMIFDYNPQYSFEFGPEGVTMSDISGNNTETVLYVKPVESLKGSGYKASLEITDIKSVIDSNISENFTMAFGNHEAVVITDGNISNIISEGC